MVQAMKMEDVSQMKTITHEQFQKITEYLIKKKSFSLLAIQISYYAGLRIGEVAGLSWNDVNLEEQHLTIRRSLNRNSSRKKLELGATKSNKIRIVDFGDTLAEILRKAKKEQLKQRLQYGELYKRNYYKEVKEKNRIHYELYSLDGTQEVPEMLGHSAVSTTMKIYAHATREAKRNSVRLLDKVAGND